MGVFRKLVNIVLLANGVSAPGEKDARPDKWAKFRAERERWEREQAEQAIAERRRQNRQEDERRAADAGQTSSGTISNRSTSTNP